MTWRQWWKIEVTAGLLIAVDAWPLSGLRFCLLLALGVLFSVAYHQRVVGQDADH